jgi:hypothetical protein
MAERKTLMPSTHYPTTEKFESMLALLQRYGRITRNQADALLQGCARHLPAHATVEQRNPKGTTYVDIGAHQYRVNNRAELIRENP